MNDLSRDLAACVEALEPTAGKRSGALSYNAGSDVLAQCARFIAKHHAAIAALQARCEAYTAINLGWIAHVLDWYAGNAPDSLHAASASKQARLVRAALDAARGGCDE